MKFVPAFLRALLLPAACVSSARAQSPLSIEGAAGNPFGAPSVKIRTLYDYRAIDNVSESIGEFLELNGDLPGSVIPATLTVDAARRNLRGLLAGDKNRAFLRSVSESPKLRTIAELNGAAMIFFADSRSAEALACLVLASEMAPNDPSTLLNLAAAALAFRQANEAVALVGEAERIGDIPPGAWGIQGTVLVDYLRGYAFMIRGEYPRAKPPLHRVIEAEPNLKEAALTLALVEAKLGENPRREFLLGVWRHRGKLVVRDTETPESEEEAGREHDPFTEGEDIAPSMEGLFDVSQGAPGRLPALKRPTSAAELSDMTGPYTESMLEAMNASAVQHNDVSGSAYIAFENGPAEAAYKRRMIALYNRATIRYGVVADLDRAARETDFLRRKLDRATEDAIEETMAAQQAINMRHAEDTGPMSDEKLRAQYKELNGPTEIAIARTQDILQRYHQALETEFNLRSAYMHGMLAHIGAPQLRTALLAEAESVRYTMQIDQLSAVINLAPTIGAPTEISPTGAPGGEAGKGPVCSDDDAKWSVSVDVKICSVEVTCNSVSFEIESPVVPPFVSVSAEIGFETSGAVTVFAGPKFTPNLVGVGGSVKEGLFLTAGKDGIRGFGGKSEVKTSIAYGPVAISHKEAEGVISFLPGPDPGEPPGPLPLFR